MECATSFKVTFSKVLSDEAPHPDNVGMTRNIISNKENILLKVECILFIIPPKKNYVIIYDMYKIW